MEAKEPGSDLYDPPDDDLEKLSGRNGTPKFTTLEASAYEAEDLADRIKLTLNLGDIDADDEQRVRALELSVRKTKRNNRDCRLGSPR